MKTKTIIAHLESIDKKNLIVRIITQSKSFTKTHHGFTSASGCLFFIGVDLQFEDFGSNNKNEFAIKSKTIELIWFKKKKGKVEEFNENQKLIVEDFFRNYFIPDLYFVKPENKNHCVTHTCAN